MQFLTTFNLSEESALEICSARCWPRNGQLTLATIGAKSEAFLNKHIRDDLELSASETVDLFHAVREMKELGSKADPKVVALTKQRSRLESVWTLSRRHISEAAQGVMRIMAFFPPEPLVVEAFVWGSVESEEVLHSTLQHAREGAVVLNCRHCTASQVRVAVRKQLNKICGISLLRRVSGEDGSARQLCMHPAVSSVIRAAAASEASGAAGALACARMCGPSGRDSDHGDVTVTAELVGTTAPPHSQRHGGSLAASPGSPECVVDDPTAVKAREAMSRRLVLACEAWANPQARPSVVAEGC